MAKAARAQQPELATAFRELCFSGAPGAPRVAPTEFLIFEPGPFVTVRGTKQFTEKSAKAIMDAWTDYGNVLSIDYGHAFFEKDSARDPAEQFKAAGYFTPELRDGALWATKVDWSVRAKRGIEEGEFKFTSPALTFDGETGEITSLFNVALTATPATKGMRPLFASRPTEHEPQEPPPMKSLLALLALTADASETAAIEAVQKLQTQQKEFLELCSAKSASEALGTVQAWKSAAAQLPEAQKRIEAIELASKKAEVDALLASALASGKVLPPQVEFLSAMGLADPTRLKAYLDASSKQIPAPVNEPGTGNAGVAGMSKDELALASAFGNDPKKVAATKARIENGAA